MLKFHQCRLKWYITCCYRQKASVQGDDRMWCSTGKCPFRLTSLDSQRGTLLKIRVQAERLLQRLVFKDTSPRPSND